MERRTTFVDGHELEVVLRRKPVRNVNARLRGNVLEVSAPLEIAPPVLERAVTDLARRLVRRKRAREINGEDDAGALARRVAARFRPPLEVGDVSFVTTQRARWGSYSLATGAIRLNAALREMPVWVLEAVVAHELAHAVHPDHSAAFSEVLRDACPRAAEAMAFLRGATWIARRWRSLGGVERAILSGPGESEGAGS